MYADNLEQGLQVCRLLKEIEPKEVYTVGPLTQPRAR